VLMAGSLKLVGGSGAGGTGSSLDDAAAQATAIHAYRALQHCGQPSGTGCTVDDLVENEPTLSSSRGAIAAGPGQVTVASSSGNTFTIALGNGVVTQSCTKPGAGSCPATRRW